MTKTNNFGHPWFKIIQKLFYIILVTFIGWFTLHTSLILIDGLDDNLKIADLAVVFGNEVTLDGQPSARLKARLDKAIEIFNNQQTKILMVSGGTGKEGFDEAKVMSEYLYNHGISWENIIIDSLGINTESTAQNTAQIMLQNQFHSVIIVSQYFHISRAKLAFQKAGITEVFAAHANYYEWRDLYAIPREFFAYYAYLLK